MCPQMKVQNNSQLYDEDWLERVICEFRNCDAENPLWKRVAEDCATALDHWQCLVLRATEVHRTEDISS